MKTPMYCLLILLLAGNCATTRTASPISKTNYEVTVSALVTQKIEIGVIAPEVIKFYAANFLSEFQGGRVADSQIILMPGASEFQVIDDFHNGKIAYAIISYLPDPNSTFRISYRYFNFGDHTYYFIHR